MQLLLESYNSHSDDLYAEIHLRTYGHGPLPPRAVRFPDGPTVEVNTSHQDRLSVLLRPAKHPELVADLKARIDAADADEPEADIEMTVDVYYR